MTLTAASAARSVQLLGALGALLAVVLFAMQAFPCGGDDRVLFAIAAVAIDLGALKARHWSTAAALSILKPLVVLSMLGYMSTCPPGTGFSILLASALPSVVGAFMLRFGR